MDTQTIIRIQWLATAGTVVVAGVARGPEPAVAALLGGSVSIVATSYFIRRVFRRERPDSPGRELASMYRAEVGKLTMVVALLAAAFAALDGTGAAALAAGFIVAHLCGALAAMWLDPLPAARNGENPR